MSDALSTAISSTNYPVAPDAPMPHRKVIRSWLIALSQRVTLYPILLLIFDYTLLFAALAGTVFYTHWAAKLGCGLAAGFMIGRIFIIGHDACHQSLTPHRTLNKWLGRIAFLYVLVLYVAFPMHCGWLWPGQRLTGWRAMR